MRIGIGDDDGQTDVPPTISWVTIMKYWWYDSIPRHLGNMSTGSCRGSEDRTSRIIQHIALEQ
jgi:hypothetical protein